MFKIGVHLRSYHRKIKTGVPLFWTTLYVMAILH